MPGTLPTIRGAHVAIYPVQRANLITVATQRFLNGSEQRFKRHAPLGQFQLVYKGLLAADRDTLKAFVATSKTPPSGSTFSFTIGNTYPACAFVEDAFTSVERGPNLYDVTLRFRQTVTGGSVAGAGGSSFPVLSTGATSQRPFTQTVRYRTTHNDSPTGMRYAYEFYGTGAGAGFPTRGLLGWKLEFPSITDADMATLEAFFVKMNGRWQTFTFTDPDSGTVYPKTRFDQDAFTYNYVAMNQASTTIQLVETN